MNEPADPSVSRLQREAEFHDHTYAHSTRDPALKYYAVAQPTRDEYRKLLLANARGKRVLEYGCGQGSYAFELAAAGAEVTGIDISAVAIEQSEAKAKTQDAAGRTRFLVANAEATPFDDDSFDLICGTGILHHLDLKKSYAEIARLLAKGGCAIFSEPLGHNPAINWYRNRTPAMRTPDEHPLMMADLRLANNYFMRVDLRYHHCLDLATIPLRNTFLFHPVRCAAAAADQLLMAVFPPFRRWAWMVTMIMTK